MGPAFLRHAVAGSLPGFLIPRKNRQLLFIAYAHHRVALLKLPIVRSQEPNLTVRCEQAGQLNSISTSLNSSHKGISVFLQTGLEQNVPGKGRFNRRCPKPTASRRVPRADFSLNSDKTKVRSQNAKVFPVRTRRNGQGQGCCFSKLGEVRWIKVLIKRAGC